MGGQPSKGTPADNRLKGNQSSEPKFGTPAWDAKYGPGKAMKPKGK